MDKTIEGELLDNFIEKLRRRRYADLRNLVGDPQCEEVTGRDGKAYQVEFEAQWDDYRRADHNLRVIASIDDGTFFAALRPLTRDFIIAPDGSFVSESSSGR